MPNQFVTLNAVVRYNQIEARPDLLLGDDESASQTPQTMLDFRAAIAKGFAGGKITWALSWHALHSQDPNWVAIRAAIKALALQHGDDVTYTPGAYFANVYSTRAEVNAELDAGLGAVRALMGEGFAPQSVVAGFLSAANQAHLAQQHGIHVCQGNVWSQYSVDNQDGDGSVCYPYYPSKEHFCKPAQSQEDFIDCVNLDGWTVDFLAGRHAEHQGLGSRTGVGPIETLLFRGPQMGMRLLQNTTRLHLQHNLPHNGFGWVTASHELYLESHSPRYGYAPGAYLGKITEWLQWLRTEFPQAQMPTLGAFGLQWRAAHPHGNDWVYCFDEDGTPDHFSDADMHIRWHMTPQARIAALWPKGKPDLAQVIDLTRYDVPAAEPQDLVRNWSLFGEINQKQTRPQDAPVPLPTLRPLLAQYGFPFPG